MSMRTYHERIEGLGFFIAVVAFAFLISAALLCLSFGDDVQISVRYLVYRPSFTASDLTSLRAYGLKNQGQPAMNTRYELAKNATAYATIWFSTASLAENSFVQALLDASKMQKIGAMVIRRFYDSRTAGMTTEVTSYDCKNSRRFVCPPYDFDRDWTEVIVSSP